MPVAFEFWFTLGLVVVMTFLLIKEYVPAPIVLFGTMMALVLGGVITVKQAFKGFSNDAMLTVAFLYVLAAAIQSTGIADRIAGVLLGKRKLPISLQLLRFLTPVAISSAFMNNTTIVAALMPAVRRWAKMNDYAASKFLLPLSYATILGGLCSLIGTSTNLVVQGFLLQRGHPGMGFFEIAVIGIPVTLIGVLYISFIGHRLLPDRRDPTDTMGEHVREFVVELKVTSDYPHAGKTVLEAGLRSLKGLFLFQIEREGAILAPVARDERMAVGDLLFFTGMPETILEVQKTPGLVSVDGVAIDIKNYDSERHGVFEAVISGSSPIEGMRVRDSDFNARYDAVILAVHRNGERVSSKVGDIVLRNGDTLLLLARKNFAKRWYNSGEFYLVTMSEQEPSKPRSQAYLTSLVLLAFIVLAAAEVLPTVVLAALSAIVLLVSHAVSKEDVHNMTDWSVLLSIASAFAVGKAIEASRVASFFAGQIIGAMGGYGVIGILLGVYLLTNFYTAFITNNAAAALLFPIAVSVAHDAAIPLLPLALIVAGAASAEFSMPIGYQTNLMVFGPGGYRTTDYLKIGLPLSLLCAVAAVSAVYLTYF